MMIGQGAYFEIWNLSAWEAQISQMDAGPRGLPPGLENFSL